MKQIIREAFTNVYESIDDFSEGWKNSIFYTEKDFYKEYEKHQAAMQHIAAFGKIFIIKNWEKITDWSKLNVTICDNSKKPTEYYNYIPSDRKNWSRSESVQKFLESMEEHRSKRHNPITSVTNVVLDPSDGDFSLDINGKPHFWIDDESVIIIADYIEKQLKIKI